MINEDWLVLKESFVRRLNDSYKFWKEYGLETDLDELEHCRNEIERINRIINKNIVKAVDNKIFERRI